MGWNDRSPYFEMIEAEKEAILDEAFFNNEIISEEKAYQMACDLVSDEMRLRWELR